MKRLICLCSLLFMALVSAAPFLPQQGAAALSAFLTTATDRGNVPGVVVAVVNKDGTLYHEAFGRSSTRGTTTSRSTRKRLSDTSESDNSSLSKSRRHYRRKRAYWFWMSRPPPCR